jgi:hypothetical protein
MSMLFDEQQSPSSGDPHLSSQKIFRIFQQWWHVVTHPQKQTLSDAMDKATWRGVILQLLMLVIGAGLWFSLVSVMRSFPSFIGPFASLSLMIPSLLILLLTVPLSMAILHGLALLFGGKGTLLQWTYINLLFLVPLFLVQQNAADTVRRTHLPLAAVFNAWQYDWQFALVSDHHLYRCFAGFCIRSCTSLEYEECHDGSPDPGRPLITVPLALEHHTHLNYA